MRFKSGWVRSMRKFKLQGRNTKDIDGGQREQTTRTYEPAVLRPLTKSLEGSDYLEKVCQVVLQEFLQPFVQLQPDELGPPRCRRLLGRFRGGHTGSPGLVGLVHACTVVIDMSNPLVKEENEMAIWTSRFRHSTNLLATTQVSGCLQVQQLKKNNNKSLPNQRSHLRPNFVSLTTHTRKRGLGSRKCCSLSTSFRILEAKYERPK